MFKYDNMKANLPEPVLYVSDRWGCAPKSKFEASRCSHLCLMSCSPSYIPHTAADTTMRALQTPNCIGRCSPKAP